MEIAVNEEFVQLAVDGIIEGAKTGNIGDGKIFVSDIKEAYRIRNKEKGESAL